MPKIVAVCDELCEKSSNQYVSSVLHHLKIDDTPIVDITAIPGDACVLYFVRITTLRIGEEIDINRLRDVRKKAKSLCLVAIEVMNYFNWSPVDFSTFDDIANECVEVHLNPVVAKRSRSGHTLWVSEDKEDIAAPSKSEYARWVPDKTNDRSYETVHSYLRREGVASRCSCVIL